MKLIYTPRNAATARLDGIKAGTELVFAQTEGNIIYRIGARGPIVQVQAAGKPFPATRGMGRTTRMVEFADCAVQA